MASREKTKEVYETADKLGLSWPLDDDITNADLEEMLFPGKYKSGCRYVGPDYSYIHRELAKPEITMALLWEEYCRKCHESGETPYMSTQFGDKYRRWARVTKATMRIQHNPGDTIQVDWAGDTQPESRSARTCLESAGILTDFKLFCCRSAEISGVKTCVGIYSEVP